MIGEIFRTLGAYARGQLTISLIMSAMYAVGFGFLRVPVWLLVAFVCGFLNMIPFGTVIGMLLAMGLSWAAGREFLQIVGVAGVVALVSGIESYVLTPRILGRELGLRPLHVFLAILIGSILFGFWGLLLAAPLLAIARVIASRSLRLYPPRSWPPSHAGPSAGRSSPESEPRSPPSSPNNRT